MNELALFAGAGGGILAGQLLGWHTVCAVENDAYAASILVARQNDGFLEPFPIWDDVRTFDGTPWRGIVDVISGGFPCQDISSAGKGAGIDGARSGLWKEMARIIGEVRPRFVFVENSPLLIKRGLAVVLGDLASMGYDAQWGVLGARDTGAPHKRDRFWLLGTNTNCGGFSQRGFKEYNNEQSKSRDEPDRLGEGGWRHRTPGQGKWWKTKPPVCRVADGVAGRVGRLRAIGNGQVPAVAAAAFRFFMEEQGR